MAFECPHCSTGIPGVVTEETLKSRLSAKSEENKLLKDEVRRTKSLAESAETLRSERDSARLELSEFREGSERSTALRSLGIDSSTEDGAKAERGFLVLYRSAVSDLEEGERPSFRDWIDDENGARVDPLLERFFQSSSSAGEGDTSGATTTTTSTTSTRTAPGSKAGRFPPETRVGDVSTGRKKMEPGALRKHLQGMSPAAARQWMETHGADYGMTPPPKKTGSAST